MEAHHTAPACNARTPDHHYHQSRATSSAAPGHHTLRIRGELGHSGGMPGWRGCRQLSMLTDTPGPHLSTAVWISHMHSNRVTLRGRQAGGPASFCKEGLQRSQYSGRGKGYRP
jgi:hypothetical protein